MCVWTMTNFIHHKIRCILTESPYLMSFLLRLHNITFISFYKYQVKLKAIILRRLSINYDDPISFSFENIRFDGDVDVDDDDEMI